MGEDEQERRERVERICRRAEIENAVNELIEEARMGGESEGQKTGSVAGAD